MWGDGWSSTGLGAEGDVKLSPWRSPFPVSMHTFSRILNCILYNLRPNTPSSFLLCAPLSHTHPPFYTSLHYAIQTRALFVARRWRGCFKNSTSSQETWQ